MKKIICFIIVILILFSNAACTDNAEGLPEYKTQSRTIYSQNEKFIFKYPQITSKNSNVAAVNVKIENILNEHIKSNLAPVEDVSANIDFSVVCLDKEYISISFEGYYNAVSAAHPINFYYTVNLKMSDGSPVELTDIAEVDNSFIQKFRSEWKAQALDEAKDYLEQYTDEQLKVMLTNNDDGYGVCFSFSENDIFIFFPIAHAIGDYVEINIKR